MTVEEPVRLDLHEVDAHHEKIAGPFEVDEPLHIEYAGKPLGNLQRCFWKVRVWNRDGKSAASHVAWWETGLNKSDWTGDWITAPDDDSQAHPLFRKAFSTEKRVVRARAVVACLGYFELYVNGRRVGDHVLDPVQSDFSKRVYYVVHDVTEHVQPGDNVVGLALGNGWYKKGVHGVTLPGPAVLAELHLTFEDGSTGRIVTDTSWKSARSHITPFGGFPHGEHHDARLARPGWNGARFDDTEWKPAAIAKVPPLTLSAQLIPPNRVIETLAPTAVRRLKDGTYLLDFGKNLTGRFRLRMDESERKGSGVFFDYFASHFAEGDDLKENMNQHDRYTCRGDGSDVFESRFNYRAFRYVKVCGLSRMPEKEDASAMLICTDNRPTSTFECSDPILNQLHEAVVRTHRCLTLGGIQVDCPHRERLGYGAEGQASLKEGLYNFDMGAFYTKWTRDFRDGQDPETGSVAYTGPFRIRSGGGPAWPAAIISYPYETYRFCGDRRVLEENFDAMKRWIAFLESKTAGGIFRRFQLRKGADTPWEFLGDWAAPGKTGQTFPGYWPTLRENKLFNACNYAQNLQTASRIAAMFGQERGGGGLRRQSKDDSRRPPAEFYDSAKHRYTDGPKQQTYLAYPLLVGATPEADRSKVLQTLIDDITKKHDSHLDTGVLGSRVLLDLLIEHDRSDLIHAMAAKETFPGWGHMMARGASTLWEHWYPAYSPACSSIHNSYLAVGDWFFRGLAGIRPDWNRPGFKHIVIRPAFECDLDYVRAEYDSIRGPIRSRWERNGDEYRVTVSIPPGTTAEVHLPTTEVEAVRVAEIEGKVPGDVRYRGVERGRAVFELGSGETVFGVGG